MNQYWSWLLTAVGITGFILAGKKVWWCWYINIFCQILWFAYAIVTEQWGFLAAAGVYTYVFSKNAILWTREHYEEEFTKPAVSTWLSANKPIGQVLETGEDERGFYCKFQIENEDFYKKLKKLDEPDREVNPLLDEVMNLVEKRIKDGTATSEEIVRFLRLGGTDPR